MSQLYNICRKNLLSHVIDWNNHEIRLYLLGSGYVFFDTHSIVGDLQPNVIANEVVLQKGVTDTGWAYSSGVTFFNLTSSVAIVTAALVHVPSGTLMAYLDSIIGAPLSPNNEEVFVVPSLINGVEGWFRP
jgi:hypothetical protein